MAATMHEGHSFEMVEGALRVDGKTHWNKCFGCYQPCEIIMGNENKSGLSKCCTATVAALRYGHVLPDGITLPPVL